MTSVSIEGEFEQFPVFDDVWDDDEEVDDLPDSYKDPEPLVPS
ncbi:hypothetical protein [Microlunatus soli]|nr:hypothetical protein [Microlunatus soli]